MAFRHFLKNPLPLSFHIRRRPSLMVLVSIFFYTVNYQRSRKRLEVTKKSFFFQNNKNVFPLGFSRQIQRCHSRRSPRSAKGSKWPP